MRHVSSTAKRYDLPIPCAIPITMARTRAEARKCFSICGVGALCFKKLFDLQFLALHFGPCRGCRWRDRDGL